MLQLQLKDLPRFHFSKYSLYAKITPARMRTPRLCSLCQRTHAARTRRVLMKFVELMARIFAIARSRFVWYFVADNKTRLFYSARARAQTSRASRTPPHDGPHNSGRSATRASKGLCKFNYRTMGAAMLLARIHTMITATVRNNPRATISRFWGGGRASPGV